MCWIRPSLFILVLSLIGVLAQPNFHSLALAQRKGGELKAQQVPANQASPPKARIHGVKSDPNSPLKLYSATAGGLEVSDNGGRSWQPLAVGGRHEEVFALAVHPSNPDTLFVGRRDGLWKSKDGGRSWSPVPYPNSVPLSVAFAKSDPDVLYLAT
ncbi:MAG: WD40/YVTN/BNR-like repeat-containing protein, partial [Candidatus Binatia bacterium]